MAIVNVEQFKCFPRLTLFQQLQRRGTDTHLVHRQEFNMAAACFVSGEAAPGAAVQALLAKEPQLSLDQLDLVCSGASSSATASSAKYAVALAASRHAHTREVLANVARSLQPGARLYVYETAPVEQPSASGRADALHKDLVLSGFSDIQQLPSPASGALLVRRGRLASA